MQKHTHTVCVYTLTHNQSVLYSVCVFIFHESGISHVNRAATAANIARGKYNSQMQRTIKRGLDATRPCRRRLRRRRRARASPFSQH